MDLLTGDDASILAILAQGSGQGSGLDDWEPDEIKIVMEGLSCEDARIIARNIIARNRNDFEARAFLEWAANLKSK